MYPWVEYNLINKNAQTIIDQSKRTKPQKKRIGVLLGFLLQSDQQFYLYFRVTADKNAF